MKKLLLFSFLFIVIQNLHSQIKVHKPYLTGTANIVFGINEHYTIELDDGEPLILPSAFLLRFGVGHQLTKRWAVGLNIGFDYHFKYDIVAIPTYGSLRYNIAVNSSEAYFIEANYGKMWRTVSNFGNGNYYGVGFGGLSFSDNRWKGTFRVDINRKKIAGFKNGNLDSISIGFGFTFF
ncbi:hypothetical protein OD91_1946 [Lutibacter sp. Hel_I_33_5]|uniref:hypothetical protein n=1 Tax=Lutibacter sp. Hel_I_33_5 TaxID=1566289 RepID=UPI0011A92CEB|nr:hypothetical protein [Lutibacter sp. Hel_I_33_5]TVZ56651.1 hypothetical protein OD91_1946 [Lutibacter sp. Hel_I_33_5]